MFRIANARSSQMFTKSSKYIFRRLGSRTGGQIVYDKLIENKIKDVFLYSGGAVMPIVDAFYNGQIKYYINTHEQNAGHAATAYAKSTGNIGVVITTSGPGLTNLITAMTDAQYDSTPLLVISGQVPISAMGTNAFQECPATDITRNISKWVHCIKNVQEIPEAIDHAIRVAMNGKQGVVHLDVPKCVSSAHYTDDREYNTLMKKYTFPKQHVIDHDKIYKVASLINNSKSPVMYLGKGASECQDIVKQILEKTDIPVTTTIHGLGIVNEEHPLALRMLGMHGSVAANNTIQSSDCIIAVGSRFDDRTIGNINKYAPVAKNASKHGNGGIIHCNIEENQIGGGIINDKTIIPVDYSIVADSKDFLSLLSTHLTDVKRPDWIRRVAEWQYTNPFTYMPAHDNRIKTQDVIVEINKHITKMKKFPIITTGVGNHQMMAAQFITWTKPNRFITSGSLGVMGAGLPYAVGAQIANPNDLVIDIDGDGSFNQTLSDLKTVKEYDLPIKIAIMNDGHLSMVKVWEELFYKKRYTATSTVNPDYCKLADSFGIEYISCDNINDLPTVVELFLNHKGPILCDFKVLTDICLPLVAPGKGLNEMLTHMNISSYNSDSSLPPS
jgi:acetolactate synthase-1/2/3 large subunit